MNGIVIVKERLMPDISYGNPLFSGEWYEQAKGSRLCSR